MIAVAVALALAALMALGAAALLQPVEGEDNFTLLTCTPYGINSHRLLVTGVPTQDNDEQGLQPVLLLSLAAAGVVLLLVVGVVQVVRRLVVARKSRFFRRFRV